jgi:hypothetical protein
MNECNAEWLQNWKIAFVQMFLVRWKILQGFAGHCLKTTPGDKCRWFSRTAITCSRIDRAEGRQILMGTGWEIRSPQTNNNCLSKLTCHRSNQPWNDKKRGIHNRTAHKKSMNPFYCVTILTLTACSTVLPEMLLADQLVKKSAEVCVTKTKTKLN